MNVLERTRITKEDEGSLDNLEQVLELLEDFSTLAVDEVLREELVWESSLGWYASRYYHYSSSSCFGNKSIDAVKEKWGICGEPDPTYYKNLQKLYERYLKNEVENVNKARKLQGVKVLTIRDIESAYDSHRQKFIDAEKNVVVNNDER
jgi:hypothetical protein